MLTFNDNKAGMGGLDKEKIQKIIESNTSGNYSDFSKKQQMRIEEKVAEIKNRVESATREERKSAELAMKNLESILESSRDLSRDCVCIDMDAYFAAVEMRDNPFLRTVPMAVGTSAMLSTSNYLARRFGVRAGMPGFISKKLCPSLHLVPGNYDKYTKVSRKFSEVFLEYDSEISMMSLDEAYIDLTEYLMTRTEKRILQRRRFGGSCICWLPRIDPEVSTENTEIIDENCKKCQKTRKVYIDDVEFGIGREEVVREIRFRVEQLTGLTCSAGISANFMLAKICSDFNKPNGQFVLENDRNTILTFLRELPIRKVGGIGRVSEAHLQSLEIRTVGDMLLKKSIFPLCFSPLTQESFLRTALGLPGRPSAMDPRRKSVSVERTFSPTNDFSKISEEHTEICRMLAEDVKKIGIFGAKTVTLKLKLSSFDVITRSITPPEMVTSEEEISKFSMELLEKEKGKEVRLLGVRLSQLIFVEEEKKMKSKTITDFYTAGTSSTNTSDFSDPSDVIMMDTRPCPICGDDVENLLETMNLHVDKCIQKLRDDDGPELICISVESRKPPTKPPMKKRKIQDARGKSKKILTIDSFLKRKL